MNDFKQKTVEALHLQIARHLERKILDGDLEPRQKLPTTQELAKSFGVTPVTIQKSLQHLVSKDLIERFPRRGTFVKNAVSANTIGLVFGYNPYRDHHSYYSLLVDLFRELAKEYGINLKVYFNLDESIDQRTIFDIREDLVAGKLKGLIAIRRSPELSNWLDSQQDLFWISLPRCDYRNSMHAAIAYLRGLGYQKIKAVSRLAPDPLYDDHQQLFEEECEGLDLAFGGKAPDGVLTRWGQTEHNGYTECKKLFSDPDARPDALFINHDILSKGALFALMELGIRIPDDLGFLTHYNNGCNILSPVPLTRLEFNSAEDVRQCLTIVKQHLQTPLQGRYQFEGRSPGRLVVGKSCKNQTKRK
jgi:DNA-binding LacI/PurR family transcriptional regulator